MGQPVYTVAVREKGKSGSWLYFGADLKLYDTTKHSKPLTREQCADVKRLLIEGAVKLGRPVECRIVRFAS